MDKERPKKRGRPRKKVLPTKLNQTKLVFTDNTLKLQREKIENNELFEEREEIVEISEEEEEEDISPNIACMWLKERRNMYTPDEISGCLKVVAFYEGDYTKAAQDIVQIGGFEKVTPTMLKRWDEKMDEKKKRGPYVNSLFERCVIDNLIVVQTMKVDSEKSFTVTVNAALSYSVIVQAAKQTLQQQMPRVEELKSSCSLCLKRERATEGWKRCEICVDEGTVCCLSCGWCPSGCHYNLHQWKEDPKIGKLQFTDPWIAGFLNRNSLRRRKIVSSHVKEPTPDIVQEGAASISQFIKDGEFTDSGIISADETAVVYGISSTHVFQPTKQKFDKITAISEQAKSDRRRITALIFAAADGLLGPSFLVIKCSVKGADLSSSTVLSNLKKHGFSERNGYVHRYWEKVIANKKVIRPYLLNVQTGDVITCQCNAWMDAYGTIMWIETVLLPWQKKRNVKILVIWDNCKPHQHASVLQSLQENEISFVFLPPNCTAKLQIMDRVVNGPIKQHLRNLSSKEQYERFVSWRKSVNFTQANDRLSLPAPFDPGKATTASVIQRFLAVMDTVNENLPATIRKDFQTLGFNALSSDALKMPNLVSPEHGEMFLLSELMGGLDIGTVEEEEEDALDMVVNVEADF